MEFGGGSDIPPRLLKFLIGLLLVQHAFSLYVANTKAGQPAIFEKSPSGFQQVAEEPAILSRQRRHAQTSKEINHWVSHLNDSHQQLMVHWVGVGSNVVMCVARTSPISGAPIPSSVYISYDYGSTFVNKTDYFALDDKNTSFASLDRFTPHPKFNKVVVFIDAAGKAIFTSTNYGNTIKRKNLDFHPSEITFLETDPSSFLALDKIDPSRKLWLTRDLGESWEMVQESVKTFALSTISNTISSIPNVVQVSNYPFDKDESTLLFVLRQEPTGKGTILSSPNLFSETGALKIWMNDVDDFQIKGNFMFASQSNGKGKKELFISYKRGPLVRAVFMTELERINYFIADVSDGQVFVVAAHTNTVANLYASMSIDEEKMTFALAHERIFCYFPNHSWRDTWLSDTTEEAFADFYKVEGLRGIYIASFVTNLTDASDIGPQHLQTMITYDRGVTWQPLKPPMFDDDGSPIKCLAGCSLHLSQRFNQLYPSNRAVPILSSPSAPGIILATGVIGKSLKGRPGVFLSRDGGLSWHQILKDYYFFSFGDYGSVLTAVKFYRNTGETRELLYSTDEGEHFRSYVLPMSEDLRVYGLMTEPGFNTTVFTMFGSRQEQHQWLIVKVDLKDVFDRNCEKEDYKVWYPHADDKRAGCLLGLKETYERRLATSNCYNGRQYVRPIQVDFCECQMDDFECDYGFERDLVNHHCVRKDKHNGYDPYAIPSYCPPGTTYNRTKGYRRKLGDTCLRGMDNIYLPDEIPCPLGELKEFLLVAQRDRIARIDLKDYNFEFLPIINLKNVIGIEFDMRNNCIYWADVVLDVIMRQCLRDGKSKPEILIQNNLVSIEGLSLDWVSNNMYFVDGVAAKISLFRTDVENHGRMRTVILDKRVLKKPRGIAVHPKLGFLFWTDWDAKEPSVSRSNLDGTNVKHLVTKPLVEWPNGLTIDTISERIYWVDARKDYIGSSDLEGTERSFRKILSGDDRVTHPFAVAVFKENMFWDDWKNNCIFSADKNKGSDVHNITGTTRNLMDLKVFAHSVQEGTNKCASKSSNNCSHICVGAPHGSYACLCPENMVLVGETCLCPGKQPPNKDGSCPLIDANCKPGYFTCPEKSCIPEQWVCDKEKDCINGADELNCNQSTCKSSQFMCKSGMCIPSTWVCDHDVDCLEDDSDEIHCDYTACKSDQFTCANRRCIPNAWRCDEENDCLDNSDEIGCNKTGVVLTCKPGEFRCGNKCIPTNWRCDGEKDCPSGEDEKDCANQTCPKFQFQCENKRCIVENWVCDGEKDCTDGSDERNCTNHTATVRPRPVEEECYDWTFKCTTGGKCIPYWWKCDGVSDCGDKSDEVGCDVSALPTRPPTTPSPTGVNQCQPHQFRCASGDCIQQAWVCDGMKDCDSGEDEAACHETGCGPNQFQCRMDGSCVFLTQVCDGRKQCPDGSDEEDCDHKNKSSESAGPSCAIGYFPCDEIVCMALAHRCDGKQDCYDGSDEAHCSNDDRVYQVMDINTDPRGVTPSSILIYWSLPKTYNDTKTFSYLPSYAKVDEGTVNPQPWINATWITATRFRLKDLTPYTMYNITVYVRETSKPDTIFPPAKYITARTADSTPSPPIIETVDQFTPTLVTLTWREPDSPNGHLQSFTVYVSPPTPPYKQTIPARENHKKYSAQILMAYQPGVNYTFWMVAHNEHHESQFSAQKNLVINSDEVFGGVGGLRIEATTENSITAVWRKLDVDHSYSVRVRASSVYPLFPDRNTTSNTITVDGLPPGAPLTVEVARLPRSAENPPASIQVTTAGVPLAPVEDLKVRGNHSVRLSWAAYSSPSRVKNVPWVFGIYYATNANQLLTGPKMTVSGGYKKSNVDIPQLEFCESYLFAVGVVQPFGPGPLSKPVTFMTDFDENAPPKKVSVSPNNREMFMVLTWSASCPNVNKPIGYEIAVDDISVNKTSRSTLMSTTEINFNQSIRMMYGATYRIWVTTTGRNPRPSPAVEIFAPPIPSPVQVHSYPDNGSYVLYWSTPPDLPKAIDIYHYEIALVRGTELAAPDVRIITTNHPTYILENVPEAGIYSFAVRLVTEDGHKSVFSEITSFAATASLRIASDSDSSVLTRVLVPCLLVLVVMSAVLVFFIVRHRRLQRSFTNFANSHYDRRSGSTTFSGDGLEDEDSPVIRGFSDDEPLVIA